MAVNLSPIWGAGAQLFDNSGNVLSGGKIYTYAAGTTTPATTYTSSNGITANSNPIVLNSAGRVPYEIWLSDTIAYKFVLKDSNDTLIATYDNLIGINSNFIAYTAQQEIQTATAGQTVFTLTTMQYQPATNNLSVYVDGVNQYGPGAQYAYVETDTDTVTFVNGLHVGASVKFTTASPVSSSATNAENVAYDPPFTGSVGTNVEAKLAQTVSVKDFGAVGDGVTDDTDAINDCLASAKDTTKCVFIPAGRYMITQIVIPGGIEVFGVGIGNYGNSLANDNSVLWQVDGVNKDAVVFTTTFDGTYYRIDPTYIHDLVIKKANSPTDTIGNGINFADAAGNYAMVNGDFIIERVQIRGFPENGIYAKQGGDPCYFRTVDTLFNGGYGIKWEGQQNSGNVVFDTCAGDGNKGGAAIYIAAATSNSNFDIYNLYAEFRADNPYGNTPTFNGAQPWAVQIGNCNPNGVVMISGIESHSIIGTEAPDAAIYLRNTTAGKQPYVTWRGVKVEKPGTTTGNAYVFKEFENGNSVDYFCVDGCWANYRFIGVDRDNGRVGFGTQTPQALVHSNINTLSSSKANANWYGTKSHTSGYFDVGYLTGSTSPDWFTYSDSSGTSIGSEANKPVFIYADNVPQLSINPTTAEITPGGDGVRDLGSAAHRWATVFAVSGTINTSDEREKQQIRPLDYKEKAVALAIKARIKAFKFNDAVAEKGDKARIHFGVIAQDVKAAFEAEGLNADDYGVFCYDEWDEQPEIKDDEGRISQEYRAAGNRMGVRYDELLTFILSVS